MKTLIGIGEDGHFNTAAANTYPGGFCELLVRTIVEHARSRENLVPYDIWSNDNIADDAKYDFALDPFLVTLFHKDGYAPDFHGRRDHGS